MLPLRSQDIQFTVQPLLLVVSALCELAHELYLMVLLAAAHYLDAIGSDRYYR